MPVASSSSFVLRWPNREEILRAVANWARELRVLGLVAVGIFGSYARGDWGVGSDVDLIVIVEHSERPPIERPIDLPLERLPVPADALVYTRAEWEQLPQVNPHFASVLAREVVWVYGKPEPTEKRAGSERSHDRPEPEPASSP